MPRLIPRPDWIAAVFSCLFLVSAFAQKEPAVGVAPPQPVELAVKVRREGKTEIPLRIHGVAGEPLRFLIRTPPTGGKLSEPRATGRETAVVVYEPPADLQITTDRFFVAVQSLVGVSAPVEVAITITDRPPQLTIPDTLDFPTQLTGTTSSKLLEITNGGGGIASGEVIVEAPWKIEGKTGYRLAAGDIAVFKLFFAPTTGGTFEKVARFTSDPAHSTTLRGVAESAIAVEPATLTLQQEAGDPVRSGSVELINQTDEAQTLHLKADPRLQLPPQVELPPRGRLPVRVATLASDVRALATEVVLTAKNLEFRLPVTAAEPGAVVRATSRAVAFGRLTVGTLQSATFELENIGGTVGEVTWSVAPPFRTAQNSTLLLPGEKRAFPIEIQSAKPGAFRAWLQCKVGEKSFDIPVEAEIVAPQRGAPMPDASALSPTAALAPTDADAPASDEPAPAKLTPSVPSDWFADASLPAGVKVTHITPQEATLEWPVSLSSADRFRIELRVFGYDPDRKLTVNWQEIPGLAVRTEGQTRAVTIKELQPAQPWAMRVLPLKPDGQPDAALFTIAFSTPPKTALLPKVSPIQGLLLALVGLIVWQIIARRQRR